MNEERQSDIEISPKCAHHTSFSRLNVEQVQRRKQYNFIRFMRIIVKKIPLNVMNGVVTVFVLPQNSEQKNVWLVKSTMAMIHFVFQHS